MGDAGEGLIDAESRIQERMDQLELERSQKLGRPVRDPERMRMLESLRLARTEEEPSSRPSEGALTHAVYGSLTGDKAVFKVLSWTGGSFQINFEGKTKKQTTTLNTQGLLMEGLRMLDESKRDDGGAEEEEEDVLLDS